MATNGNKRHRLVVRVDDDLLGQIEEARGLVSVQAWLTETIKMRLSNSAETAAARKITTPLPRKTARVPRGEVRQRGG